MSTRRLPEFLNEATKYKNIVIIGVGLTGAPELLQKATAEVPDELDAAIRLHVKYVYEKYNNNLSKTAEALKAARNTVRKYLEKNEAEKSSQQ